MSVENSLIIGLATTVWLTIKLSKEFMDADTQMHEALFALCNLFVIGMIYTGLGIAQNSTYTKAEAAYTTALLITTVSFIGYLTLLIKSYMDENQKESLLTSGDSSLT